MPVLAPVAERDLLRHHIRSDVTGGCYNRGMPKPQLNLCAGCLAPLRVGAICLSCETQRAELRRGWPSPHRRAIATIAVALRARRAGR